MIAMSQIIMATGIVLVLHSAFSCLHYRELLRDLEESGLQETDLQYTSAAALPLPPMDVWIEVFSGAMLILFSELIRTGSSLQPVTSKGGFRSRPIVAPGYRSRDFDIYTSRARALH